MFALAVDRDALCCGVRSVQGSDDGDESDESYEVGNKRRGGGGDDGGSSKKQVKRS